MARLGVLLPPSLDSLLNVLHAEGDVTWSPAWGRQLEDSAYPVLDRRRKCDPRNEPGVPTSPPQPASSAEAPGQGDESVAATAERGVTPLDP